MQGFSHLDEKGRVRMVDVTEKKVNRRKAIARGEVLMNIQTIRLIRDKKVPKGDVLTLAKVAGIMAAKKTGELIPLCHPLNVDWIDLSFKIGKDRIKIFAEVKLEAKTGVEMEALTAVAIASLTIYDMCKAVDKEMVISEIKLEKKVKN